MIGAEGFVVLPDVDGTRAVEARLLAEAPEVVRYPSGRPWVIGRWQADELTLVDAGALRVVLIGCCPVDATRVRSLTEVRMVPFDENMLIAETPGGTVLLDGRNGEYFQVRGGSLPRHGPPDPAG